MSWDEVGFWATERERFSTYIPAFALVFSLEVCFTESVQKHARIEKCLSLKRLALTEIFAQVDLT